MLGWLLMGAAVLYAAFVLRARLFGALGASGYPSPSEAEDELEALARAFPALCAIEPIGASTEGRPIRALRLGTGSGSERPRLLVTAHIHAVEYVGSYVARRLARHLAEAYGSEPEATALLDAADLWIVPLLNPDGAERVWRRDGWSLLGGARFTANGVDPNRNFPFGLTPGAPAWNSGRDRPGSAYYRGPHPLSEPECLALARLCRRERFCGAINFHSFGGVVYLPEVSEPRANHALDTFHGAFQSRQPRWRYRPIRERASAIAGQLDAFLLGAFGTPSATDEVSRLDRRILKPSRFGNVFWIANPEHPEIWADNDVGAAVYALQELLRRTGGRPCDPLEPELAESVPD